MKAACIDKKLSGRSGVRLTDWQDKRLLWRAVHSIIGTPVGTIDEYDDVYLGDGRQSSIQHGCSPFGGSCCEHESVELQDFNGDVTSQANWGVWYIAMIARFHFFDFGFCSETARWVCEIIPETGGALTGASDFNGAAAMMLAISESHEDESLTDECKEWHAHVQSGNVP